MAFWTVALGSSTTSILWAILLTAFLVMKLVDRYKNKKVLKFMAAQSGPISIPVFGNGYFALKTSPKNLYEVLRKVLEKYPNAGFWLGSEPYYITGDLKVFNAVLSSHNINKTSTYDFFKIHGKGGLIVDNGNSWRDLRRVIIPCFKTKILASFDDNMHHHTNTFMECLEKYADSAKAFNVYPPVQMCYMDLVSENLMRCRLDIQNRNLSYLSTNMEKAVAMQVNRAFNVFDQFNFYYSITGKQKMEDELFQGLVDIATEVTNAQIEYREEMKKSNTEMAGLYIDNLLDGLDAGKLTKERAISEVVEMFIAGSITQSATTSWMFKIFGMRPDIQRKVYEEIIGVCGERRDITLEDVAKFDYLEMVMKETLRHFGPPFIGRRITEDLKVDEETTIPAGIRVFMVGFALHHDPQYWEKPNEFYPEHFSQMNEIKRPKGAFVPFSGGPRICPGTRYAYQAVKYIVAKTLLHYEFSTDELPPENYFTADYRIILVMFPKVDFKLNIKRRPAVRFSRNG